MSNKTLSPKPHRIKGTDKIWWYESPAGIDIVTCYGGHELSEARTIPWRAIRNALERKDKP